MDNLASDTAIPKFLRDNSRYRMAAGRSIAVGCFQRLDIAFSQTTALVCHIETPTTE
jgi:hypothetical protein